MPVYYWCVGRTNIDIDGKADAKVMRCFDLKLKLKLVNFALRTLASEPLSVEQTRRLRR